MTLREVRLKHQKTQEEVANFLGVQQNTYSQIENGKRSLSVVNAKKLGEFYKINWWLFYEK